MTVYEIPNIENCTVEEIGTIAYRITANSGWYIHIKDGDEETANIYKTATILILPYDFSIVEIIAAEDLPEGAVINGGGDNDHEVM